MASIPASQLVSVQPGVISSNGSPLSLNSVILTQNTAPPIGSVVPFANAAAVAAYFGASSAEAAIAAVYFNGYTGATILPGTLYFAQFAASAVSAYLRGMIPALTLAQLQAIIPGVTTASVGATCTGSIATTVLTVASAVTGVFHVGQVLSGTGVAAGTTITSLGTGTGGVGTYNLSNSQTTTSTTITAASTIMDVTAVASGAISVGQLVTGTGMAASTRVTAQLTGAAGGVGTYSISGAAQTVASATITGAVDMSVTIDGSAKAFTTLNLAAASSFSAAATLIGTALSLSGGQTCTYDSTFSAFKITSGTTGAASTLTLATGAAATLLGLGTGATLSQGAAAMTEAGAMSSVANATQNWAAFMTMWEPNLASKLAFAVWTNAQNQRYMYVAWDTDATITAVPNTTSFGPVVVAAGYSGIVPVYSDINVAAMICGITASINFTQTNGRVSYAYRGQSGIAATVTDATVAQNLTANGYNFYASYATANAQFTQLQPGSMPGVWKWIDSYVNQIYLNSQLQLAGMTLMTNVNSLPYNNVGYQTLRDSFTPAIEQALNFGTIRTGVTLSVTQVAQVNMGAGVKIDQNLSQYGYYLQVLAATATQRVARGSPPCTLWYMDGGAIQKINLASIDVF